MASLQNLPQFLQNNLFELVRNSEGDFEVADSAESAISEYI